MVRQVPNRVEMFEASRALYECMAHISEEALELYCLDRLPDEEHLARIEEHLLVCRSCIERAESTQYEVDAIRRDLLVGELTSG